ncbi:hypothetical protein EV361DRAFT_363279 [Lentinula raphanica]|uniref:Uncharacterized protein n=1 Tax=Lentinula raphanica TaxID=153919 RepID=A0AA38PID2_9AGAR|nr:hypothetical protein F5878DRAFT_310848 [Lentinula raphanica]KAJ3969239.1 hypothetical protein EV361DRAFT_363279 [Lentinula raphanica]
MVEHPPTSHQAHYIAGPSSNDTRPTSSSVYRPSTNPGFWTSTSARTTYASYKSHPGAWEANYLSTVDDFKLFSFGRPDATPDDERWNITMREGDETSSSSSDDGESRRRARGKSRDVTPRASLVSLDVLASHSDSHSRSHPSQLQQINYYHRGTDVTGNKNSDIHFHYDEDHHHPSELQESNNEQARRLRSDISIYSYDTGYDAASSYRSGSRTGSYAPSYTSSQVRDRAEAEAEAISISSSRPASSGTSGLMLDGEFDPDDFSISSARRSFSFDANSEQYGGAGQLSDVLRLSDSERMSLDSATSSYMHVSVSSLRFDGESQGVALDQHNQTENPRESITGVSAVPIASNNQNLAPPSQRTRPRSLSTSAAAASLPSSSTLYTTAAPNAAVAGFDLTYITSGLSLNANATSHTYVPHPALEDLDFVRKTSTVNRGDLRGAERGEQVGRGVPMGWEDDYTIPTPFINITPERKRTRAATVTAAVGSTPGILAHTNINSGPPPRRNVQSTSAGVKNPIARSRSPSQSRHKHSSSSLHKDLTALLDQSEINSANGMLNAARIHDSLLSVPPGAVRRKRSAFANLTALGIGSSSSGLSSSHTEETEDEMTHSKPPVSPVSPARTIKGEAQRKELEPERYNTDHSIFSAVTPGLSKITKSGSSSESRDGASGAVVDSSSSFSMSHSHPSSSVPLSLSTRTPSPVGHTSPKLHDSPQVLTPPSGKLSAPRDDALTLMVRGDPDRVGTKWAWVIQKERKEDVFNVMDLSGSIQVGLDHGIKNEQKEKEPTYKGKEILREVWTGMSVGSEEVWENYLLGRFSVLRDDHDGNTRTGGKTSTAPDAIIRPKSSGGGGGKVVDGGADVNVLG